MRTALIGFCLGLSSFAGGDVDGLTDAAFLDQQLWNDGAAEVSFYRVRRHRNQYGQPAEQEFPVGTYLVKHEFDRGTMSKGKGGQAVSAFKYALFYEFESLSYQYKRNYVINLAQAGLLPLKQSFSSFDWCSNLYRETAFQADGKGVSLVRSDDYGNQDHQFNYPAGAFPTAAMPLLIRSLDFSRKTQRDFFLILGDGQTVAVSARLLGEEKVKTAGAELMSQRIQVTYERSVPSLIGEKTGLVETYWRGVDPARLLLKLAGQDDLYVMTLEESLRSPYWRENLYDRLKRVRVRP